MQKQEAKIVDELNKVNLQIIADGVQTKKGNVSYQKWRRDQIDTLNGLRVEETVFQKLKNSVNNNTVFAKLKRFSE